MTRTVRRAPGRNSWDNWHGEKRTNGTHVSPTDPQAKLFRKGQKQGAKFFYVGHVLMGHREGLAADVEVPEANGHGAREAALAMLDRHPSQEQRTVAADKGYDTADFIAECRKRRVTPHVAMNLSGQRGSAIDARNTPSRLPRQPEAAQAGRGLLRLGQGRPTDAQDEGAGKQKVAFVTTLTVGCCTLLHLATLLVGRSLAPA